MKGGAMMKGGAILAMDGLRRGGKIGVAETTAGGALIGAKFGGPLGALIGGIARFAAGMVRLFIKGAVEKARQKIKDLYGVVTDGRPQRPRLTRLMALAIKFQGMIDHGEVEDYADLAELGYRSDRKDGSERDPHRAENAYTRRDGTKWHNDSHGTAPLPAALPRQLLECRTGGARGQGSGSGFGENSPISSLLWAGLP